MPIDTPTTTSMPAPATPGGGYVQPIDGQPPPVAGDDQQTKLQAFIKRRHPEYHNREVHWCFVEDTYEGGRDWFHAGNIFRYIKEGDKEFGDRVNRAYRFNHTREVVDLVQKYIFKSPIIRNLDDASPELQEFWEETTQGGLSIDQFMKLASSWSSIYGSPWIFTDSNKTSDIVSKADEKNAGVGVYAYLVKPQNVLDMGFAPDGTLNWVLVRETTRDDSNWLESSGAVEYRFRLWTTKEWRLFKVNVDPKDSSKIVVEQVGQGDHNVGEVPGFPVNHVVSQSKYFAPGLIDDIAYLDRAVANYLSNLDAIIQDQTFSQLAMPAQGMMPGDEKYNQLVDMGTKRIFVYDGEGGAAPAFISPDPRQAQIIITVINKIINEIYHTIGMAGERTKQDNAAGIDNSSGVAKAYDFERMNSLLTSKADSLEDAENKLVRLFSLWHGIKDEEQPENLVKYPDTFDVRSLFDEFTIAERLALVEAPDTVRREQMNQVIEKLFPRLADDIRKKIEADLLSWPPQFDLQVTATVGGNTQPVKFPATGTKITGGPKGNNQGQVTKNTP